MKRETIDPNKKNFGQQIWGCFRISLIATTTMILVGCTAIPTKEFEAYKTTFNTAKSSAQDVITKAQLRAESLATLPENPSPADVKVRQLNDRTAALDARLEALELISKYNDTLTDLAAGTDPSALQGNIEEIRDGLSGFGFKKLTALVSGASPYTAAIAQAVSTIDQLIKQKKFKEAVVAGKQPITDIVKILIDDADSLQIVEEQWISLQSDKERAQITDLKFRLIDVVADVAATDELKAATNKFSGEIQLLSDPQLAQNLQPTLTFGQNVMKPTDLEAIRALTDQAQQHVATFNKLSAQIEAYKKMISEYKQMLVKVSEAIATVDSAVQGNRLAAVQGFIDQALKLRKAILAVENTK